MIVQLPDGLLDKYEDVIVVIYNYTNRKEVNRIDNVTKSYNSFDIDEEGYYKIYALVKGGKDIIDLQQYLTIEKSYNISPEKEPQTQVQFLNVDL